MEVQAVDIDSLCVNMCYIQLTLLHVSAEVIHGNSLTLEVFKTWYTPAYIMNATKRQVSSFDELKEDEIKVKVPNDSMGLAHFNFYAMSRGFEKFTETGYRSVFVQNSKKVASYREIEEYFMELLKDKVALEDKNLKPVQLALF